MYFSCYHLTFFICCFSIVSPFEAFSPTLNSKCSVEPTNLALSSPSLTTDEVDNSFKTILPSDQSISKDEIEREKIKKSLLELATQTKRGFTITKDELSQATTLINRLALLSPSSQPAADYYENSDDDPMTNANSISGKWTLVFTDAPDITSLDATTTSIPFLPQPPSFARLGRIGQECDPSQSSIKNVIEWERPEWVDKLPGFDSSSNGNRVLQKVCCTAKASPSAPSIVELTIAGLDLVGDVSDFDSIENNENDPNGILGDLKKWIVNGPAGTFAQNPIELRGIVTLPFGKFEILYLDQDMRIIRTGQGYFAVNVRGEEWF